MEWATRDLVPTVERHLAIDERGVGLRATWRLDRGFVNLSLWRDDTCVETFHLSPSAAADLIGFLVRGLADVSSAGVSAVLRSVPVAQAQRPRTQRFNASWQSVREVVAAGLERLAVRLRPLDPAPQWRDDPPSGRPR